MAPLGAIGSCELYSASAEIHRDFALQVCNERIMRIEKRAGKDHYKWLSRDPHDYLDCMSMCYAAAADYGLTAQMVKQRGCSSRLAAKKKMRPKIRVV